MGIVNVEFYPESSDPREWVATFIVELLVPGRQLQAERSLWRFWRASATTEVMRVLDLLLALSEPDLVELPGTSVDTLQQLQKEMRGTSLDAVISEFERNPLIPPRELINLDMRRGSTYHGLPSSPHWSVVLRLVEATTARREWDGDTLVFTNLRGPIPHPNGRSHTRSEPFYQLFTCHSLSVDPNVETALHMAYDVRVRHDAVRDWRDRDDFNVVSRHIRSKGVYSTEGNRYVLPSAIVRPRLEPQDTTFFAGWHGWIYLMDEQTRPEPILSLP